MPAVQLYAPKYYKTQFASLRKHTQVKKLIPHLEIAGNFIKHNTIEQQKFGLFFFLFQDPRSQHRGNRVLFML